MKLPKRFSRFIGLMLLLGGLSGCSYPQLDITITPEYINLLPGQSVTLTVRSMIIPCEVNYPNICFDLSGQLIDYEIDLQAPGVSYSIDYSLRSPSTPGVAQITLTAASSFEPNDYPLIVKPLISGSHRRISGRGYARLHSPMFPEAISRGAFTAISAGAYFSLALNADGRVWSAGGDFRNELGRDARRDPNLGLVSRLSTVQAIAAGVSHALALDADGEVWVWGSNRFGLGVGVQSAFTPTLIADLDKAKAITAGRFHSMALGADGRVWSWGQNRFGQLGDGTTVDRASPVQVAGLSRIQAIAAGAFHSLALADDGSVWVWGNNGHGELGLGDTLDQLSPVRLTLINGIQALAAGFEHSLALGLNGRVWAWGSQRGDGVSSRQLEPTWVSGLPAGIQAIAAGGSLHSLALAADGSVWSWGYNSKAQLGDGTTTNRLEPRPISGLANVQAIAAGWDHSLALTDCGQLWVWGSNGNGQLAQGTIGGQLDTPRIVPQTGLAGACPQVSLQLTRLGTGRGSIEINGTEPACTEADCSRYTYAPVAFNQGSSMTLAALADMDSVFTSWLLDCTGLTTPYSLTLDQDTHCAALFESMAPTLYLLSVQTGGQGVVNSSGGGQLGPDSIDCGSSCEAIFAENTLIDLSVTPAADRTFAHWSGDCSGTSPDISVLMDGAKICIAHFILRYQMTVSTSGQGTVTSQPAGIDCGTVCNYLPNSATVQLTANPAFGWTFNRWGGDCSGTDPVVSVSMDDDKNCSAEFVEIPQGARLIVLPQGQGSFSVDPTGADCGTDCFEYLAGTQVTISATPDPGYIVTGWTGCDNIAGNQCTVTVDQVRTVEMSFGLPTYTLTTGTVLPNSVSSQPGTILCGAVCSDTFDSGQVVTLTANPAAGWRFNDWFGDCSGTSPSIQVTMDRDKTCRASFIQDGFFTLTVAKTGSVFTGRIITVQPAGNPIDCGNQCSAQFAQGTLVQLTPDSASLSIFNSWSGCTDTGGSNFEICFVAINSDVTVTAVFD